MNVQLDTHKFSVDNLREIFKRKEMLPARGMLKEKIDERFDLLKSKGIITLFDLLETLKTKQKIEKFSKETGISEEYLTLLRREANSYVSVPVKLRDLPFENIEIIEKLESGNIEDSEDLITKGAKPAERELLAEKLKIPLNQLLELVQLSDLIRITGVGPVFARIIFDSGIHSVKEFMSASADSLWEKLSKTNQEKGLTKVKFSIKDINYCLELGKYLPIVVEP